MDIARAAAKAVSQFDEDVNGPQSTLDVETGTKALIAGLRELADLVGFDFDKAVADAT